MIHALDVAHDKTTKCIVALATVGKNDLDNFAGQLCTFFNEMESLINKTTKEHMARSLTKEGGLKQVWDAAAMQMTEERKGQHYNSQLNNFTRDRQILREADIRAFRPLDDIFVGSRGQLVMRGPALA